MGFADANREWLVRVHFLKERKREEAGEHETRCWRSPINYNVAKLDVGLWHSAACWTVGIGILEGARGADVDFDLALARGVREPSRRRGVGVLLSGLPTEGQHFSLLGPRSRSLEGPTGGHDIS